MPNVQDILLVGVLLLWGVPLLIAIAVAGIRDVAAALANRRVRAGGRPAGRPFCPRCGGERLRDQ